MDHKKLNRQIAAGIIGGIALGLLFAFEVIPAAVLGINLVEVARFVGNLFTKLLKVIVVPLVFFSIFCGVSSLGDMKNIGRLGRRTIAYYLVTTFIAVTIGLVLVNVIRPGVGLTASGDAAPAVVERSKDVTVGTMLTDQVSAFFINPFQALAEGKIIPIILASIFLAIGVLKATHAKKQVVLDFMSVVNEAVMHITQLVLRLAPIGIAGILIRVLFDYRLKLDMLVKSLSLFALTSLLGLAIHGFIVLPLILKFFSQRTFREFFGGIAEALQVAFGTDSSSATMPVTLNCVQDNLKVSKKTSDFVIPIGATINMDGTALYEAVCALFIAQALGMELSFMQQVIVFFTATVASVGAAGIPSAGLVTLVLVINAVGIPYDKAVPFIGTIWAIDRFIDMCRTTVNVEGDCVGCVVIDEMESPSPGDDAADA